MTVLQDLGITSTLRLGQDDTLVTPVMISLFTDARAKEDDLVPNAGGDLRGWWGDQYLAQQPGESWGSRIWALQGGPIDRAEEQLPQICEQALQWMIDDGYLTAVEVEVERTDYSQLSISLQLTRPSGVTQDLGPFSIVV